MEKISDKSCLVLSNIFKIKRNSAIMNNEQSSFM